MNFEVLKNICEERKSIRSYLNKPVSNEDIERIKNIAFTSPYASGRKNWDLIVVDDKKLINEVAYAVKEYMESFKKNVREDFSENFSNYVESFVFFSEAPVLFIPTYRCSLTLSPIMKEPKDELLQFERDNYIKSISCVGMLVLLAAQSLGLGGCYMTGPLIAEKEIIKLIKIKNGHCISALIPVGHEKKEMDI